RSTLFPYMTLFRSEVLEKSRKLYHRAVSARALIQRRLAFGQLVHSVRVGTAERPNFGFSLQLIKLLVDMVALQLGQGIAELGFGLLGGQIEHDQLGTQLVEQDFELGAAEMIDHQGVEIAAFVQLDQRIFGQGNKPSRFDVLAAKAFKR